MFESLAIFIILVFNIPFPKTKNYLALKAGFGEKIQKNVRILIKVMIKTDF